MFLKTSTFNQFKSQSIFEDIFRRDLPEAKFGMKQCRDKSCRFCYERLDLTKRFSPAMHFSKNQVHQFVNQYKIYLNADVVS